MKYAEYENTGSSLYLQLQMSHKVDIWTSLNLFTWWRLYYKADHLLRYSSADQWRNATTQNTFISQGARQQATTRPLHRLQNNTDQVLHGPAGPLHGAGCLCVDLGQWQQVHCKQYNQINIAWRRVRLTYPRLKEAHKVTIITPGHFRHRLLHSYFGVGVQPSHVRVVWLRPLLLPGPGSSFRAARPQKFLFSAAESPQIHLP